MIPDVWQLLLRLVASDAVVLAAFLITVGCGVFAVFCLLAELVARITCRLPKPVIATTPAQNAALEARRVEALEWLAEQNQLLFARDLPALLRRQAC